MSNPEFPAAIALPPLGLVAVPFAPICVIVDAATLGKLGREDAAAASNNPKKGRWGELR